MHAYLATLPMIYYSEYVRSDRPGQFIGGVRNEDLSNLCYPDGWFDLLLTSDTLEHVPDLSACLNETRRVLKPGGRHVLTVPVSLRRAQSRIRAELAADGTMRHLHAPVYHGRGAGPFGLLPAKGDYLAFTDVGADFPSALTRAGFIVEQHDGENDLTGASTVYCATAAFSA